VPDYVVGMAIAGQVNNNGLEFGKKQLDDVVSQICKRWEDQEPDPNKIRKEIISGITKQALNWPDDSGVWVALRALGEKDRIQTKRIIDKYEAIADAPRKREAALAKKEALEYVSGGDLQGAISVVATYLKNYTAGEEE
jgi:hypothetical protein